MQKRPRGRQGFSSSRKSSDSGQLARTVVLAIVAFVIASLLFRSLAVNSFRLSSDTPHGRTGDRIIVSMPAYAPHIGPLQLPGIRTPRYGDVVVMRAPGTPQPGPVAQLLAAPVELLSLYTLDPFVSTHTELPRVPVVRRVVGLPGDRVRVYPGRTEIHRANGAVQVLGRQPLVETDDPERDEMLLSEYLVPVGEYFVDAGVGDAVPDSGLAIEHMDSRHWGPIPKERFIARAILRYWPFDRFGSL